MPTGLESVGLGGRHDTKDHPHSIRPRTLRCRARPDAARCHNGPRRGHAATGRFQNHLHIDKYLCAETCRHRRQPNGFGDDQHDDRRKRIGRAAPAQHGRTLHLRPADRHRRQDPRESRYCDYVDADGDHVFEKWDYPVQPLGAVNEGTGEWIGGTGKYAGISGTMKIRSRRLNSLTDGAIQVVGEKLGSYSFTNAVASAKRD